MNHAVPHEPWKFQHDTASETVNRIYMKTFWVIDSYHGRLNHLRMFKDQLALELLIPVLGDFVREVTARFNGIRGPIYKTNP